VLCNKIETITATAAKKNIFFFFWLQCEDEKGMRRRKGRKFSRTATRNSLKKFKLNVNKTHSTKKTARAFLSR
jgi:hypothetical protein